MKYFYRTTLFLLFLIFSAGTLFAQTADRDRIDRDIRIAEGILAELFDPGDARFSIRGGNVRGISGEYIPDYGVHFKIGTNINPRTVQAVVIRGHAQIETSDEPEVNMNREFVEERFMEYFKEYAPLLRGVPDNEVIRLTFGANSSARSIVVHRAAQNRERHSIPSLTAWATVSDIRASSDGNISGTEFEDRITILDLAEQETKRDQEVFSSILETSLNQAELEHIRIRRNPTAEHLPGLGIHYSINASLAGNAFSIDGIEIRTDSLAVRLSGMLEEIGDGLIPIATRLDSIFNRDRRHLSADSLADVYRDSLRESARQMRDLQLDRQLFGRAAERETLPDEEVQAQIDRLHEELRRTVTEYGSTLRSLQDDEMLMITVHWSGRHSALPERSELRIRASDLRAGTEPNIETVRRR